MLQLHFDITTTINDHKIFKFLSRAYDSYCSIYSPNEPDGTFSGPFNTNNYLDITSSKTTVYTQNCYRRSEYVPIAPPSTSPTMEPTLEPTSPTFAPTLEPTTNPTLSPTNSSNSANSNLELTNDDDE